MMEQISELAVMADRQRNTVIRTMTAADGPAVLAIYQAGIDTGHATFESAVPDWAGWDRKYLPHSRVVAANGALVLGWSAVLAVSSRAVYRGVAEVSVYVAPEARGLGLGRQLLTSVIAQSEDAGIWTLLAGTFPENQGSIALHKACGFRVIGVQERVGRMESGPYAGRWRDVVRMERRSPTVGRD